MPLGALRAGPAGSQRREGIHPHMQSCAGRRSAAGETCDCGAWAGGSPTQRRLRSAKWPRCFFASGPAAGAALSRLGGGAVSAANEGPDTGLPVPTSRAQSRLSDLSRSHTTALRRPSLASLHSRRRRNRAARGKPSTDGRSSGISISPGQEMPPRYRRELVSDRPAAPGCRGRGQVLDLTEFRALLPATSEAPRACCDHGSAAAGLSKGIPREACRARSR